MLHVAGEDVLAAADDQVARPAGEGVAPVGALPAVLLQVVVAGAPRLASYKLPERLELIPSLPLVPTGNKVDKRRLLDDLRQKLAAE